jgi:hypothetical protein
MLPLWADTIDAEADEQDIQALREWINTKRQVTLKELGGDLALSGEVRTEFQTSSETVGGVNRRGRSSSLPAARNSYDIEVNLMLDYRTDRTWASIKLEFDNDAGIFNGTVNKIALERAYWGVRLIDADNYSFDVEIGRRFMSTIFDSKVEFGSTFDGALLRYDQAFESIADFYIHPGALLVFDRKNQFAYVVEVGMLKIANTGLYAKYSIIDWYTKHYHKEFLNNRFRFLVSQWILGYRFKINCIEKIGVFYAAGLWNHLARRLELTNHRRANWGAYIGLSLGQLRKQWDWAFDINYQLVAAQVIPDFDVSGIGIGNADKTGLYTRSLKSLSSADTNKANNANAGGNTNYRGFAITFDLLLTDKLDWQQSYMQSVTLDKHIGPFRRYHQYEMEFIYSW